MPSLFVPQVPGVCFEDKTMKFRTIILLVLILLLPAKSWATFVRITMNSDIEPPAGYYHHAVETVSQSAVVLNGVPTSTWTYGCSPTAAGMIFGYYDRNGYSNMYTGPANGGVAPLTDLGSTSLIASKKSVDGRTTNGHVDDYWISYGSSGPDPWETNNWEEHTWDSVADFLGTSQWKWDFIRRDGRKDYNLDGSTALWSYRSGAKLFDYIPPASYGLPQTSLSHGMRLFAEARSYIVLENYTQKIDALYAEGFSFDDYIAEIDAGWPVMIQLDGHSMVGVGYDAADESVYVHDTWDNSLHSMTWGHVYAGMDHIAVTVIHLDASYTVPEPATICLLSLGSFILLIKRRT